MLWKSKYSFPWYRQKILAILEASPTPHLKIHNHSNVKSFVCTLASYTMLHLIFLSISLSTRPLTTIFTPQEVRRAVNAKRGAMLELGQVFAETMEAKVEDPGWICTQPVGPGRRRGWFQLPSELLRLRLNILKKVNIIYNIYIYIIYIRIYIYIWMVVF